MDRRIQEVEIREREEQIENRTRYHRLFSAWVAARSSSANLPITSETLPLIFPPELEKEIHNILLNTARRIDGRAPPLPDTDVGSSSQSK